MDTIVVEAPYETYGQKVPEMTSLFLAGGITNCPDWQADVIEKIKDIKTPVYKKIIIYNPRRKDFPIEDPESAGKQIIWEYEHLSKVDILCFWFARGSINPIVLYELGRWGTSSNRKMVIGIDPEYVRKQDVIIQTQLSRPDNVISENFEDFINRIEFMLS